MNIDLAIKNRITGLGRLIPNLYDGSLDKVNINSAIIPNKYRTNTFTKNNDLEIISNNTELGQQKFVLINKQDISKYRYRETIFKNNTLGSISDINLQNNFVQYNKMLYEKYGFQYIIKQQILSLSNRSTYRRLFNVSLSHLLDYRVGPFQLDSSARPLPFIPTTNYGLDAIGSVLPITPEITGLNNYTSLRHQDKILQWYNKVYTAEPSFGILNTAVQTIDLISGLIPKKYPTDVNQTLLINRIYNSTHISPQVIPNFESYEKAVKNNFYKDLFKASDSKVYKPSFVSNVNYKKFNQLSPKIKMSNENVQFQSISYLSNLKFSNDIKVDQIEMVGGFYPYPIHKGTSFNVISFTLSIVLQNDNDIDIYLKKISQLQKLRKPSMAACNFVIDGIVDTTGMFRTMNPIIPQDVSWYIQYKDQDEINKSLVESDKIKNLIFNRNLEINGDISSMEYNITVPRILQYQLQFISFDPDMKSFTRKIDQ